jgi:hypothetical protein
MLIDGGAEARGGASYAGSSSSSASARSRSSARWIRRFTAQAAQEWLRQRLPCSAVAALRPPLPEFQAPSSYRCPTALIDGRACRLRRISSGREAPRNSILPVGASSRAPPAGKGRPRSELRRRKEATGAAAPCRLEGGGGRWRREWFGKREPFGGGRRLGGRRLLCRKSERPQECGRRGSFAHFAAAVAAATGAGTIPFLSSFCASGVLWGIRWSQSYNISYVLWM